MKTAAVTLIGGGIVAANLAYQLALRGVSEVLVLERAEIAAGSSGRATGGLRQQFADEEDILFAREGVRFYRQFVAEGHEELAEPLRPPPFYQYGYLFLVSDAASWQAMQGYVNLQRSLDVPTQLLSPQEVARRFPQLVTDDLLGATFCPTDGYSDPGAMTRALMAAAQARGVEVRQHSPVRAIKVEHGRVQAVETDQEIIATPLVINATGVYAALTARLAGIPDLPVYPLRRQLYLSEPCAALPEELPMIVDLASGFHFRRRDGGLLFGLPHRVAENEQALSRALAPEAFQLTLDERVWPQIEHEIRRRAPGLSSLRIVRAWAGLYEMTPDEHPILGPTEVEGFLCACGFSGHGFMHAPFAARLLVELIVEGQSKALPIERFSLERFRRNALLPVTRLL
jgi:sarcosine oxidase subunit beta